MATKILCERNLIFFSVIIAFHAYCGMRSGRRRQLCPPYA